MSNFLSEFCRLWHHRDGDLLVKVPLQLRETKKSSAFHWNRRTTAAVRRCRPALRSGQILSLFSFLIFQHLFRSLRRLWVSSEIKQKADAVSNSGNLINHRRLLKYRLTSKSIFPLISENVFNLLILNSGQGVDVLISAEWPIKKCFGQGKVIWNFGNSKRTG